MICLPPRSGPKSSATGQSLNMDAFRLEAVPMNAIRARARHLRAQMRQMLDAADSGGVCMTQNAELLVEMAKELHEVEDEIDDCLIAQAAGI